MKQTKVIGLAVVLLVFISAAVLFVNASSASHASQGKNRDPITQSQPHQNPSSSSSAALSSPSPVEKGTEIGQKMKAVFDQNAKDKKSGSPQRDPDRVVGTVDGVDIHAKDVALKAALYAMIFFPLQMKLPKPPSRCEKMRNPRKMERHFAMRFFRQWE